MLLAIERVAILKSVDIFANTPDYILASVAAIVEEVTIDAHETLFQEGAVESSMYLVVDGEVLVHSKGAPIIQLGPGQSVGELAALDPEPRSASVTANVDTLLFRIDKVPLDEVMADRPEIAQGIIVALCRRIRTQGRLATASKDESEPNYPANSGAIDGEAS